MSLKGRHINKWNLPEHKPEPGLWEKIAKELDKQSDEFGVSKSLLSALPTHHTSPALWENIENGLNRKQTGAYPTSAVKSAIPVIVFLLTGFFIFYVLSVYNYNSDVNQSHKTGNNVNTQKKYSNLNTESRSVISRKEKSDRKLNQQTNRNSGTGIKTTAENSYKKNNEYEKVTYHNGRSIKQKDNFLREYGQKGVIKPVSLTLLLPRKIKKLEIPDRELKPAPIIIKTGREPIKREEKNLTGFHNFFTGLYYMQENIYSTESISNYSTAKSTGLNLGYKFGYIFVESGLELSFTKDHGTYSVDFLQNELINTYTKVDSIIYITDTLTSELKKQYITSEIDVYDSIENNTDARTLNSYTYLKIPLLLGYKRTLHKVSLFVKGGILLSFLINGDEPVPAVNGKEIKVINIDRTSPSRLTTNWQILLSAGISIPVYKTLSLTIEPQYRYYINSFYSQHKKNYKKPYSIGMQAGFLFNF